MKKRYYILLASLLSIILVTNISCKKDQKCCSCFEVECKMEKYTFSIRPGMDEWTKLESHQAMVDVCQCPEDILKNMCTVSLIDTYLDYPLLFTIFAFNNTNKGLNQVSNEFNGFQELLYRPDCATKFLLKYKQTDPKNIDSCSLTTLEKGKFKNTLAFIELSIGYEPVIQKFNAVERKYIIELGLKRLKVKEENNYGGFYRIISAYFIGRMLQKEEYKPFLDFVKRSNEMQLFLKGNLSYAPDIKDIKNYAIAYLNDN